MTWKDSLLWPLSLPYGAVAHLRARAYRKGIWKQRRLKGVVISVGNLTVGGTGKTPMVLWIAERLLAAGKSVGILTRGYRGKHLAPAGDESPGDNSTSDEVQLLKSRLGDLVAFGIGADRFKRGQALAARGVEWFVLDDGFQHLQLARDVDIVLIDGTNPFGGGHVLPAGRLREPRTGLARANIIVITRSHHAPAVEAAIRRDSDAPIFYARAELDAVLAPFHPGLSQRDARERRLFAFCGIGNAVRIRRRSPRLGVSNFRLPVFPGPSPVFRRGHQRDRARSEGGRRLGCHLHGERQLQLLRCLALHGLMGLLDFDADRSPGRFLAHRHGTGRVLPGRKG